LQQPQEALTHTFLEESCKIVEKKRWVVKSGSAIKFQPQQGGAGIKPI
jgi:hypothetical protein